MKAIKAIFLTLFLLITFTSSNMLFDKLGASKTGIINTFLVQSDSAVADASAPNAQLRLEGNSALDTVFTYIYPITKATDAATLYAQLLKFKNAKIDTKNIYFSFSANEISSVVQKRRGEFGDVYSLIIDRRSQGVPDTFQINILTAKKFPDKDALYNIINQLGN